MKGKCFRSWILRDWLPRFTFNHEKRIVAIPRSTKLPKTSLELLFTYDINIVYYDSLKYIIPEDGNKPVLGSNTEISSSSKEFSVFNVEGGIEKDQSHGFETTLKASNSELTNKTVQDCSGNYNYGNIQQSKLIDFLSSREQYKIQKREWLKSITKDFIPSCKNCTKRHFCTKGGTRIQRDGINYFLSVENLNEVLKCLKQRVYLAYRFGYDLFEIDIRSPWFYDGVNEFWNILKRGEIYKLGIGLIKLDGEWNEKGFYVDKNQTLLAS